MGYIYIRKKGPVHILSGNLQRSHSPWASGYFPPLWLIGKPALAGRGGLKRMLLSAPQGNKVTATAPRASHGPQPGPHHDPRASPWQAALKRLSLPRNFIGGGRWGLEAGDSGSSLSSAVCPRAPLGGPSAAVGVQVSLQATPPVKERGGVETAQRSESPGELLKTTLAFGPGWVAHWLGHCPHAPGLRD